MKKIIFLFLIFSCIVFAEWKVAASFFDEDPITIFATADLEKNSIIGIGVSVEALGYSVILISNNEIKKGDNLMLIIKDNEGDDIYCNFDSEDIVDDYIHIPPNKANLLTKMLYNGKSAVLENTDNDEILATFDLSGIKKVMQKHVGKSYWYKYKLND